MITIILLFVVSSYRQADLSKWINDLDRQSLKKKKTLDFIPLLYYNKTLFIKIEH